jgi:RecA-family ATPase
MDREDYASPFAGAEHDERLFLPANGVIEAPAPKPLYSIAASAFEGKACPPRPWLVSDMLPDLTVTMISGDGGTGKSLLALQLGVATAAARDWIGTLPEPGGVVYVSAEDDVDEIHRRLIDITAASGIGLNDLGDFHLVPLAGKDAVLAQPDRRSDVTMPTALWQSLVAKVQLLAPRLLILDNLADIFAGNENSRPQARQFIGMLRGLAIEHRLAVLIIAHPSLTGLSSGSGTSGSTAWSNSVRSRLYLDRAKAEDGDEPDPDLRVLRVMKSNYGPNGSEVRMRWDRGRFKLEGGGSGTFDRAAADQRADRVFLALLRRFAGEGRDVSDKRSPSFAPAVFAKQPDSEGCGKGMLEKAMDRLLASKQIQVEHRGPPSRRYSRIAEIGA